MWSDGKMQFEEKHGKIKKKFGKASTEKLISTPDICPEVKELMDFIAESGGRENGWPLESHNLFLKARTQHKDLKKMMEFLQSKIPGITQDDILEHETWYKIYLELQRRQKAAIKTWRENKAKQKIVESIQRRIMQERKNEDNEQKKKKVNFWKIDKLEQQRVETKRQLEIQNKQKLREYLDRKKQEKIKSEVENWRKSRQQILEAEKMLKRTAEKKERERKKQVNKSLKKFREKDKQYLERKFLTNPIVQSKLFGPRMKKHLKALKNYVQSSRVSKTKLSPTKKHKKNTSYFKTSNWRDIRNSL